ncbi:MAG: hypothetical protein ACRD15_01935, partial [Vicinamibacterales bacterium]
NYFMASVFSWLNSGGITVLVFVPLIVNYILTYWVARTLLRGAQIPRALAVWGPRYGGDTGARPVALDPAAWQEP